MAKVIKCLLYNDSTMLNDLAQRDYRAPKAQADRIIRRELERKGVISNEPRSARSIPSRCSRICEA